MHRRQPDKHISITRSFNMERSLVLIKPDAMQRGLACTIIGRLQEKGLKLVALKMLRMDRSLAERHYAIHRDKPFFKDLVEYITSTPIVASVFEGNGAVELIRKLMGATDPAKASAGTIRADFGLDVQRNSTHASDSPENAEQEIKLFFAESEIYS
jgi:nucleoside-diphosphate kinase